MKKHCCPEDCSDCVYFNYFDIEYDDPNEKCGECEKTGEVVYADDAFCDDGVGR